MKRFSIRQQMFGDLNKELNRIRAKMNKEVRDKCYQILAQKYRKRKD